MFGPETNHSFMSESWRWVSHLSSAAVLTYQSWGCDRLAVRQLRTKRENLINDRKRSHKGQWHETQALGMLFWLSTEELLKPATIVQFNFNCLMITRHSVFVTISTFWCLSSGFAAWWSPVGVMESIYGISERSPHLGIWRWCVALWLQPHTHDLRVAPHDASTA